MEVLRIALIISAAVGIATSVYNIKELFAARASRRGKNSMSASYGMASLIFILMAGASLVFAAVIHN